MVRQIIALKAAILLLMVFAPLAFAQDIVEPQLPGHIEHGDALGATDESKTDSDAKASPSSRKVFLPLTESELWDFIWRQSHMQGKDLTTAERKSEFRKAVEKMKKYIDINANGSICVGGVYKVCSQVDLNNLVFGKEETTGFGGGIMIKIGDFSVDISEKFDRGHLGPPGAD
ncbi:MAG: hypothetical protein OEV49_14935 [candidate division Zixibacteria bacterium]|nr:hypothetical protein [candidate division Zixibacteria bacterium]MDH3936494.1 hypothetical protein [candidate division Zixibacteria bacterium]MDH4032876.1 hypothetical protein [candidate division Zixibacteria bacterium]